MELKKNQEICLRIEDFTKDGEGLGKYQGFPLFTKDTVIGDQVRVSITNLKKNYGYARLTEIISPSPDRVEAPCPVASRSSIPVVVVAIGEYISISWSGHVSYSVLSVIGRV